MKPTRFARPRRAVPTAVLGAAVLAGVFGVPSASGGQPAPDGERLGHESPELVYLCDTGTERYEAKVSIGLSLLATSSAGTSVEPTDVAVRLALSESAVAALIERGATSVTGSARFHAEVTTSAQDDAVPRVLAFPEADITSTSLPDSGELRVTAAGVGPEITPEAPGELTLSAGRLNLILGWEPEPSVPEDGSDADPESADDPEVPDDGAETDVPAMAFDCAPKPGQDTTIGGFTVHGAPPGESEDGRSAPTPGGESSSPGDRTTSKGELAQGEIPDECEQIRDEGVAWCAYIGGYSNIDSLDAASRIEPGIMNLSVGSAMLCEDRPGFCQKTIGELNYQGKNQFPPSRNHFHAFGFMPNSAMVELSQLGPMEIEIFFLPTPPYDGLVTANVDMSIRIYDVEVNGTPLEVGDSCRTAEPMRVVLTATYPSYDVDSGGVLDGFTDIPPFSGCGKNGELDALMTGLISGEEYYVKMTQGAICELRNGNGCPPPVPVLQQ